jgi:hypothetical protein
MIVIGADGLARCSWGASTPEYLAYHDEEWGRPVRDDHGLYERLCLEAFQSGLSWLTILRKREGFRAAFDGFDLEKVAAYGPPEVERLMADAGIVRNRPCVTRSARRPRRAGLGVRRPWRPGPGDRCGCARHHARFDGAGKGAQGAWVPARGSHDGLRHDAGMWAGRRSPT